MLLIVMAFGLTGTMAFADDESLIGVSDFDVYSDHQGEFKDASTAMGTSRTNEQIAYVTLRFSEKMKIVDADALKTEIESTTKFSMRPAGDGKWHANNISLSDDGRELKFEITDWAMALNGLIASTGTWNNLTTEDGSKAVKSDFRMFLPNGLKTKVVKQVIADENTPASVTTKFFVPNKATRGMVHLTLLKNGQLAAPGNIATAHITGHWHDYENLTPAMFAQSVQNTYWENCALENDYKITANGDEVTITANASQPGDVLEFHVESYLNDGSKVIDATALKKAIADAKNADKSQYTEENYKNLQDMIYIGEIVAKDTTYYAQTDVDDMAARIDEAQKAVIEKTDDGKTAPGKTDGKTEGKTDGKTDQGAAAGKNDKTAETGDMTPLAAILGLLAVSGTAAGVAVKRRKAA